MGLYSDKLWASVKVINDYNQLIANSGRGKQINAGRFVGKLQKDGGLANELLRQCTWEDLENCGLPRLLARKVAGIFRSSKVADELMPSSEEKDLYQASVRGDPSWAPVTGTVPFSGSIDESKDKEKRIRPGFLDN